MLNSNLENNPLLSALSIFTIFLNDHNIPYMIFGGIANSIYGNPRQTFDIDIKITLEPGHKIETFIQQISKIGKIIPKNPNQFISETLVLPIEINKVRIDLVFADLPFEVEAIKRSQTLKYSGLAIRVCTVEDLIIHKAISPRQKDWNDIETLIHLQKNRIDWNYLLKCCETLGNFLNRSEIVRDIKRFRDEK
jgi:predicted nucleotidyltransferase